MSSSSGWKAEYNEPPVTSIRWERELTQQLKAIAEKEGLNWHKLIRAVLWQYVRESHKDYYFPSEIRFYFSQDAISTQDEGCVLSGNKIPAGTPMKVGVTYRGYMVAIAKEVAEDRIESQYPTFSQ